jgi:hypothetical protein
MTSVLRPAVNALRIFVEKRLDHFLPRARLELAAAARSDALQREQDALGILDLVQRRRTLRAVAAA